MTIEEMNEIKKKTGLSYEQISNEADIPLSTVQKVLGGVTSSPRFYTLQALSKVFEKYSYKEYLAEKPGPRFVAEESAPYGSTSGSSALSFTKDNSKTLKDYLALPDDIRVEMIDGVFYEMSAPTTTHQSISMEIAVTLHLHVKKYKGTCKVFAAPVDVQLDRDDKTMVQPDVLVVCDKNKITKERIVGAPDLTVEVLSDSSWYKDMHIKRKKYKNAGVREYWIVLPQFEKVLVYFYEQSDEPLEYTFEDSVPVNIWNGKCKVDFKEIIDNE